MRLSIRELNEKVFLLGYSCILLAFLIEVSQAPNQYEILYSVMRYLRILGYICCVVKILAGTPFTIKSMIVFVIMALVVLLTTYATKSNVIMTDLIVIMSCKNVDFDQVIKLDFRIRIVYLVVTLAIFFSGLVIDVTDYRLGLLSRHSWGFAHPNRLALHMFIIALYVLYFNKEHIKWKHLLLIGAIGVSTLVVTDGRTSVLGIFAAFLIGIILKMFEKRRFLSRFFSVYVKPLSILVFGFCILFSFIVPYLYSSGKIALDMNSTFQSRIIQSSKAFNNFGFSLFGQKIEYITSGVARRLGLEANGIDNMYVYLFINFGIIIFITVVFFMYKGITYSIKVQNYVGTLCFLLVLVMAIMENQFLNIESNVFLLFTGFYIYNTFSERSKKRGKLIATIQLQSHRV